ncbi:MAG: hypothetical protein WBX19_11855, partial [Terracidiphilus sp.]
MNSRIPLLDFGYMPSDTTADLNNRAAEPLPLEGIHSSQRSVAVYAVLGLFASLLALMKFKHEMY